MSTTKTTMSHGKSGSTRVRILGIVGKTAVISWLGSTLLVTGFFTYLFLDRTE